MNTIKVSVVIPTYNDSPLSCLKALAIQSVIREVYEVIVVDNASDKKDIKKIVDKFKFARYVREPRKGVYFARNSGWRAAKGGIIAFTDADCIPDRNWISQIIDSFNNPKIVALGGSIFKTTPYSWIERNQQSLANGQITLRYKSYSKTPYIIAANMIFKKSLLEKLGGFNELFTSGGDVDFSWRVIASGNKIHLNNKAIIFHYPRPSVSDYFKQYYRYGVGHPLLYKIYNPNKPFYFDIKNISNLLVSLITIPTIGIFFYFLSFGKNELMLYHYLEVVKCVGLISGRIKGSQKYKMFFI